MAESQVTHLVKMANQIASNISPNKDADVAGPLAGEHMQKFWSPLMKKQIQEFVESGEEGLLPAAVVAVSKLYLYADRA